MTKGFWDAKGLLTIKDYGELEAMRTQPSDVHVHDVNEFTDDRGWSESGVVPTSAWLNWNIYQPARYIIIDFNDANGHQDPVSGINAAAGGTTFNGGEGFTTSGSFTITEDTTHFPEGHPEEREPTASRRIWRVNSVPASARSTTCPPKHGGHHLDRHRRQRQGSGVLRELRGRHRGVGDRHLRLHLRRRRQRCLGAQRQHHDGNGLHHRQPTNRC